MSAYRKPITTTLSETDIESLYLGQSVLNRAAEMGEMLDDHPLISGKKPASIAAAVVYVAAETENDGRDYQTVGKRFGVSGLTVKRNAKVVKSALEGESV